MKQKVPSWGGTFDILQQFFSEFSETPEIQRTTLIYELPKLGLEHFETKVMTFCVSKLYRILVSMEELVCANCSKWRPWERR